MVSSRTKLNHYMQIDEEGFFVSNGIRVSDNNYGKQLFERLRMGSRDIPTIVGGGIDGGDVFVEAFDDPFVIQQIDRIGMNWFLKMAYDHVEKLIPETLYLDDWDRFHGFTRRGIPYVMSRKAQAEFFSLLDDYDDDSVTVNGKEIPVSNWMEKKNTEVDEEDFWNGLYRDEEPRWELEAPTPIFVDILPKLKLPKSRVLVLGCGSANDAAFFAEQGHWVTAVDISQEALDQAYEKYCHLSNLKLVREDAFKLSHEYNHSFDLIVEQTFFCAVSPHRRNELIAQWRRLLADGGHLLASFYVMNRKLGPPYGASEWELRERLKDSFQFLYWERCRNSIEKRFGKELLVYAEKRS